MECATIIAVVWTACGIAAYGITVAYFQRKYPLIARKEQVGDRLFGALIGLSGPVGLIVILVQSRLCKHGWML